MGCCNTRPDFGHEIMCHNYVPGEFWTHRIDAVPEVGRHVQFTDKQGVEYEAVVTSSADPTFRGIGHEVGYRVDSGFIVSAARVAYWRYAPPQRSVRPMPVEHIRQAMGEG